MELISVMMDPFNGTGESTRRRRRLPRSFKELTPSNHFNPRTFFYEMVWKALLTPRVGQHRRPNFPKIDARSRRGHLDWSRVLSRAVPMT